MVDVLSSENVVALDTMVFIYHIEDHPRYAPLTGRLFSEIEQGRVVAITSYLTLLELLVKPKRMGRAVAVSDYRNLVLTFPNLNLVPVDLKVAEVASDVRAKYAIRTPDSIQVATGIVGGASQFVTNDERLKKVEEMPVVLLKEL